MGSFDSDVFEHLRQCDRDAAAAAHRDGLVDEILTSEEELNDLAGSYWDDKAGAALAKLMAADIDQIKAPYLELYAMFSEWAAKRADERIKEAQA